jgi:hypothetical protein
MILQLQYLNYEIIKATTNPNFVENGLGMKIME